MYKWKKTLSFLMAVALLASTTPVAAALNTDSLVAPAIEASASFSTEDGYSYNDYGSYVEIIGYEGNNSSISIPDTIDGKPVKKIAANAFANSQVYGFLTSIALPESIEYIGKNAFAGCINVTEGYIPSKFIGICAACKKIYVSEKVTQLVSFEVIDAHTTKVSTVDGLASLYTEYELDGTYLSERALAVPEAVAKADVDGLTAENFKNFVKKYSTITDVYIYNRNASISAGIIPEGATIHGYRVSTAKSYASTNKMSFVPLDGLEDEDAILSKINLTVDAADLDDKQRFTFDVVADAGDYEVYTVGLIVDKNNSVTANNANDVMLYGAENFNTVKKNGTASATIKGSENGMGLWIRPYAIVDNGSGDKSQAITKYGNAQYIYSEDHVKNNITLTMTPDEQDVDGELKARYDVKEEDTIGYEIVKTGIVFDRSGGTTDEASAKKRLTADIGKVSNDYRAAGKKAAEYSATVGDVGNGVWAIGYTTVSLNGYQVTKYTDPVFWTNVADPFADVTVNTETEALTPIKFRLKATADAGDLKVLKTGIITNKTGAANEENAAEVLTVDSDFAAKQVFELTTGGTCSVALTDVGNGIWYVGYTVVEAEDGTQKTIYTEPQFVASEVQTDGVSIDISVKQTEVSNKFRFDIVSRTGDETLIKSGIIVNRDGDINEKNAEKGLVLNSAISSNIVKEVAKTPYAANVTDTNGKGIWAVGYVVTQDKNGNQTTTYTKPVYIHDEVDVAEANMAVKVVSAPVEGENKYRFDVTSITGDLDPEVMGVIVNREGTLTESTAAANLTLDSGYAGNIVKEKANANTYAANVKTTGKGIWLVGYVTVDVNGTKVTKYSDPVFVPELN